MDAENILCSERPEVSQWAKMTLLMATLLFTIVWVVPAIAVECACTPCHGSLEEVHGDFNHNSVPGSGGVAIFADNAHDDAAWTGPRPYFAIETECQTCHLTDLPAVHGNDCATCHPTPYDTLGIWNKGCQQGGCHPFYHEDATIAHLPFEDPRDSENDCSKCHNQDFTVTQFHCLNCHATPQTGDLTPPVTTSNVQASYIGAAEIKFTIMDSGSVDIGRTFYRLDGPTVVAAGKSLIVTDPGSHQLEFWSKDQSGNTESASTTVLFNIEEDTVPPTTTSDAKATYTQGATITLTATDASSLGVKTTYYRLNNGAITSGTRVVVPATTGALAYTLTFWSEDWSGNVENPNSVSFSVTSGAGTIQLIWGNSDLTGSPCSIDPDAHASWIIKEGNWATGKVIATGSGGCPNWTGINNIAVPVSPNPYIVIVEWWDSYGEFYDETWFNQVNIATPGQSVRLSY